MGGMQLRQCGRLAGRLPSARELLSAAAARPRARAAMPCNWSPNEVTVNKRGSPLRSACSHLGQQVWEVGDDRGHSLGGRTADLCSAGVDTGGQAGDIAACAAAQREGKGQGPGVARQAGPWCALARRRVAAGPQRLQQARRAAPSSWCPRRRSTPPRWRCRAGRHQVVGVWEGTWKPAAGREQAAERRAGGEAEQGMRGGMQGGGGGGGGGGSGAVGAAPARKQRWAAHSSSSSASMSSASSSSPISSSAA